MGTGLNIHGYRSRRLTARLNIEYVSRATGEVTERMIDVYSFVCSRVGGTGEISAYCYLRRANRTFLIENINRVFVRGSDQKTGDVIELLFSLYDETAAGKAELVVQEHLAALMVFYFVAKADSAFREKEKILVGAFLSIHGVDKPVLVDQCINTMYEFGAMSNIAFGNALRALLNKPMLYRKQIYAVCNAMLKSDRSVTDREAAAMVRIKKEMKLEL